MKKFILPLLLLSSSLMAQTQDQLTLYFIPSPVGMDWSSPANLAWSALKNRVSFKSRFMGHVFVELECGKQKQLTGMVGKNFDYLNQLLIEGRGLAVMYHSFDGTLEEQDKVSAEIKELSEEGGRMNFVRFNLNEAQCLRAQTYLKEYREKNVGRFYGLANRPLYAEGAGCSAFGASFAEVTGVLDQELIENWSHSVNIPLAFSGPPLRDESVNLLKVMMNAQSWAKESEPHQKLMFWSPDHMFAWVNKKVAAAATEKQFSVVELGKSKGIVFDKSHMPVPAGPIWQQHLDPNIKTTKK